MPQVLYPRFRGDLNGILVQKLGKYKIIPSSTNNYETYSSRVEYMTDGKLDESDWCSRNYVNEFFDIEFLDFSLKITNYTMRTRGYSDVSPVSWVVQTKINNNRENISLVDHDPFREMSTQTFGIDDNRRLNNIRFMQLESNMHPSDHPQCFCVKDIDLFGIIHTKYTYNPMHFLNQIFYFVNVAIVVIVL